MDKMLEIKHATLRLGGRSLFRGLSLEVGEGEWVCVTGESGCGKTSLLRAVLGFLPLEGGQIFVGGEPLSVHTADSIRRRTVYVPQDFFLPADTVEEVLGLPFGLKANRGRAFSGARLAAVWDMLGLEHALLHRKVSQLSGGQRQRVILSMAALLDKELLLADEPTSALDKESVGRVAALFRKMADRGAAILSVSHNTAFVQACDRVVRM